MICRNPGGHIISILADTEFLCNQKSFYFALCDIHSIVYIPRSLYHEGFVINSRQSLIILSATPESKTTEFRGLRFLGCPNCLHSLPIAVYIIVLPSYSFNAICLATNEYFLGNYFLYSQLTPYPLPKY